MEMKPSTIVDKYTRCGVSIGILADLNLCDKTDIEKILIDAGALKPKPEKKKKEVKKVAAEKTAAKPSMPDVVFNAICEKLENIENQIKYHEEAKKKLEAEYTELAAAMGTYGK